MVGPGLSAAKLNAGSSSIVSKKTRPKPRGGGSKLGANEGNEFLTGVYIIAVND